MDIERAREIFDIDPATNVSQELLRKKYLKLSLQHHPDKNNNTTESKELFQDITQAYSLLCESSCDEPSSNNADIPSYISILKTFITSLFTDNPRSSLGGTHGILFNIINNHDLLNFLSLKREHMIDIYEILDKHKRILRIPTSFLETIRISIYGNNIEYYTLTPSLHDLFSDNVFKLEIEGNIYFVPLWHNELFYEKTDKYDKHVIVKCEPHIPSDIMEIDEHNNIIINWTTPLSFNTININIENVINLNIDPKKLLIKPTQKIVFKGAGISKINDADMYDISKKSNIILFLHLYKE